MQYDKRHGGPYDRGGADSYYCRFPKPHYYVNGTMTSPIVVEADMTPEEIQAYYAGYYDNERSENFKDY